MENLKSIIIGGSLVVVMSIVTGIVVNGNFTFNFFASNSNPNTNQLPSVIQSSQEYTEREKPLSQIEMLKLVEKYVKLLEPVTYIRPPEPQLRPPHMEPPEPVAHIKPPQPHTRLSESELELQSNQFSS